MATASASAFPCVTMHLLTFVDQALLKLVATVYKEKKLDIGQELDLCSCKVTECQCN